jgi:hypothetical protein
MSLFRVYNKWQVWPVLDVITDRFKTWVGLLAGENKRPGRLEYLISKC